MACYHLCRTLAAAGVVIDFVMPYTMPSEHDVSFMRLHSPDIAPLGDTAQPGPYAGWSSALRKIQYEYGRKVLELAGANDYDAIHAHDWLTLEAAVAAKQLTGKPLIAHVHSTEFDRSGTHEGGNPLVHEIEQTCLLMADRVVAVSQATKNILVERYTLPPDSVDVVYNASEPLAPQRGVNAYPYVTAMKRRGYKVVVSLGRLTIQKGLTFLLQAAAQAIQFNEKLIFVIAGDGEQRDELVALAANLGIAKHVIFTGFIRGKQWRDTYAIGDMFVMNSVSEPFGLTALEAAGSGMAVLLTKQSGASEVLRSVLKFDFWDTTRLADCIVNLAQNTTIRTAIASDAQREVATMSWDSTGASLTTLYRSVAGASV